MLGLRFPSLVLQRPLQNIRRVRFIGVGSYLPGSPPDR